MKKLFFNWLMATYKRRKQRKNNNSLTHAQATVKKTLEKARFGFFISQGENGWVSARYVQPIIDWVGGELKIWVGTSIDSRKIAEVNINNKITMAFGSERAGANLIIYGQASVSSDPALCRKYWQPSWKMFFPGGPKSENLVVVSIVPDRIEILDFKHNITPEPFGLKALALLRQDGRWQIEA